MISPRYVWPIAALLLFALVPTVANVYRAPAPLEPGSLEQRIPAELGRFSRPEPGTRKAAWVEKRFAARDYLTRRYRSLSLRAQYRLFGARSHDYEKLFHFPELALSYGKSATATRVGMLDTARGPVPVQILEFRGGATIHYAVYALLYGEQGVEKPIRFLLARLPELIVGSREPMTLLYVQGEAARESADALEGELRELLAAAWDELLR